MEGQGRFRTPGSKIAHHEASTAGGKALQAKEWSEAELDARAERSKRLGLRPPSRWKGTDGEWKPAEVKLLGTLPDAEVAAETGRTADAVRSKRSKLGIPPFRP